MALDGIHTIVNRSLSMVISPPHNHTMWRTIIF